MVRILQLQQLALFDSLNVGLVGRELLTQKNHIVITDRSPYQEIGSIIQLQIQVDDFKII